MTTKTDKVLFVCADTGHYECHTQGSLVHLCRWEGDTLWTKPGELLLTYDTWDGTTKTHNKNDSLETYVLLFRYLQHFKPNSFEEYAAFGMLPE